MIVKNGDKLFQLVEAGPWQGLAPLTAGEVKEPAHRWRGGKRTLDQLRQVLSFFEWSYETTKSETMVHWFYHEQQAIWCPVVLPQKGHTGMTVKLLHDHPSTIPTYQRLGAGWEPMGSDHHHCSSSAFASGTDQEDEKTKEGLHMTYGGIGSAKYSIHGRTSFRKQLLPCYISDWYEVPEALRFMPEETHDQLLAELLKQPVKNFPFPEWWKENVIREQVVITTYGDHKPVTGFAYKQNSRYEQDFTTPSKAKHEGQAYKDRQARAWLEGDIERMANDHCQGSLDALIEWLSNAVKIPLLEDAVKATSWGYYDLEDILEVATELKQWNLVETVDDGTEMEPVKDERWFMQPEGPDISKAAAIEEYVTAHDDSLNFLRD